MSVFGVKKLQVQNVYCDPYMLDSSSKSNGGWLHAKKQLNAHHQTHPTEDGIGDQGQVWWVGYKCIVNVKTDLTYPEPVFLRNSNLWIPKNGQLVWATGESTVVACPRTSVINIAGVPSAVQVATSYTIRSQQTRLADLLGSDTQAALYVNSANYLARGHSTPDADGIFRTWQWATYFYVNVVPQWQRVNAGNWLAVERITRNIADRLQHDVVVYTGSFDILTLPHVNGTQVPITLSTGGITVPKWTWKIIKSPSTNAAIAFITNNDQYRTAITASELLCSDICSQY
uniref:DNA/RNA non-specific endonuclease/pyrophosphatase/phosphodiesterase domain-containing protein n=1 Tax=Anopheles epiroticus TaxID=199890 RepID=A0A182PWC4_9DIPT